MLALQIINSNHPAIQLSDKISLALQLMDDYDVQHLAVISEEKFIGLIAKEDLLDADEKLSIISLEYQLIKISIRPQEHFLAALKLAENFGLTIVPVVTTEKELLGVITQKNLLHALSNFNSVEEPGGIIVLEMERRNFSFGELSRLVETNDAIITQLNTTTDTATGLLLVTIKLNKTEISDIIATFQRYEYIIRYYFGEELYENELKENYDLLMTYLKM
ncbi:MAG: CBS domain-containing protein [Chitinophagaceae bacterium]